MAWFKGVQPSRYEFSAQRINEEILGIDGFIQEEEAKVLLYKFLRNNIGYTTKLFLGVELFPFQEMLIKGAMISDSMMLVLSRGMSKTWSCAIYTMLQLILRQGVKIGVLSSGFRQAKMILQKAEDILKKKSSVLVNGLFKLTKGTDSWTLTCGQSSAIALPLADGSRLRGFRFQILLLDEFLNIPKNIFQEVILPFLAVIENPTEREEMKNLEDQLIEEGKMTEDERYRWDDNKLIMLSSPSYEFEYMYELYCNYRDLILGTKIKSRDEIEEDDEQDSTYRTIFQLSYLCAPKSLFDQKQLKAHKETMSEDTFNREYCAAFTSDSSGYFRLSKMAACTIPDGDSPHTEIKGNPQDEYIVSLDPSWSEDRGSDDFAISIFKLNKETRKTCLVHAYGLSGTELKKHITYFHYVLTNFNIVACIFDYNGGLQFVRACNESDIFKKDKIELELIEEVSDDFDKPETYAQDLISFKKALSPTRRKFCYLRKPSSNWIRQANELLQGSIDHKRILFASPAQGDAFNAQRKADIPIEKLKWDNNYGTIGSKASAMIDFIDHQATMIELTKQETANIEVKSNPQGSQTFGLPAHMARQTGPNKPKKDNYSTLVLGCYLAKIIYDCMDVEDQGPNFETFTPFLI